MNRPNAATALPSIPPDVAARLTAVVTATRAHAAELLAGVPTGPMRRYLRAAVQKVDAAATRAANAKADELPAAVDDLLIRTTELSSLIEPHEDPLARYLSVARRVACVVLGDDKAGPVATWCGNLERGDRDQGDDGRRAA